MIGLDIEMPKCCDECPLSDHTGKLDGYCLLTHTWSTQHKVERLGKCPLVDLSGYDYCADCFYLNNDEDD